jgi:hypothetical protein
LWPMNDTELYLACPGCNVVSVHLYADVDDCPEDARKRHEAWIRISFRCAIENCGTPVEFHALRNTQVLRDTEFQLRERLRTEPWTGASPCEHPICTTIHQQVEFALSQGILRGYNPNAVHWQWIK